MYQTSTLCTFLRTLVCCVVVWAALSIQAMAQESEHSDPYTVDDPKEWHEAFVPAPFGVIGYGNLSLMGEPDEGLSHPNPTRAALMVYYDAWQAGLEMRPEATYVRLMPRSVGRDGYIAGFIEYGWATATGVDYYGSTQVTVNETRTGMGLSVRSGSSEKIGARLFFDGAFGLLNRKTNVDGIWDYTDDTFYYGGQFGVLARIPLSSLVVSAGPCIEIGSGMLTGGESGVIISARSYFRVGLQLEIALNLNRPTYLTGAQ